MDARESLLEQLALARAHVLATVAGLDDDPLDIVRERIDGHQHLVVE